MTYTPKPGTGSRAYVTVIRSALLPDIEDVDVALIEKVSAKMLERARVIEQAIFYGLVAPLRVKPEPIPYVRDPRFLCDWWRFRDMT